MNRLTRFLLYCSGTNTEIITQLEPAYQKTAITKQALIGTAILLTGVLASVSGGYALYTVFDQQLVPAIGFGILWGIIIFNLDRILVYSIVKDTFGRMVPQVLLRLGLAILLALLISRPLELRIVQDEIEEQLGKTLREQIAAAEAEAEAIELSRFAKDSSAFAARALNEEAQAEKFNIDAEKKHQEFIDEKSGRGGSGDRGYGRIAKSLEADRDNYREYRDSAINRARAQQQLLLDLSNALPDRLANARSAAAEEMRAKYSTSLLARHRALAQLQREGDGVVAWMSCLITLVFILLEISPILAKLAMREGPYEAHIAKYEHPEQVEKLKQSYDAQAQIDIYQKQQEARVATEALRQAELKALAEEQIKEATQLARDRQDHLKANSPKYFASQILGNGISWLFEQPPANPAPPSALPAAQKVASTPSGTTNQPHQPSSFQLTKLVPVLVLSILAVAAAIWIIEYEATVEPTADTDEPTELSSVPTFDDPAEWLVPTDTTSGSTRDTVGSAEKPAPSPPANRRRLDMSSYFRYPGLKATWQVGELLPVAFSTNDSIIYGVEGALRNLRPGDTVSVLNVLGGFEKLDLGELALSRYGTWLEVETNTGERGKFFTYFTARGRICHCRAVEESMKTNPFVVRDGSLLVREEALAESPTLTTLSKGESFRILSRQSVVKPFKLKRGTKYGYWCKVNAEGKTGYIFDYFTFKGLDYYYCLKQFDKLPKAY